MYVPEEDDHGNRSGDDVPKKTTHVLLSCKRLEDGHMSYFRMKRSAPLQKLMNACRVNYHEEATSTSTSTVFMHGGRKINSKNTPDELQMEDGDVIYAFRKFYCGCQKCKTKRTG